MLEAREYRSYMGTIFAVRPSAAEPGRWGIWYLLSRARHRVWQESRPLGTYQTAQAAEAYLRRLAEDNRFEDLGPATPGPTDKWTNEEETT